MRLGARRLAGFLATQAVLHHPVPQGVPGDPEARRRARDVAARLAQGFDEVHPLHAAQRLRERGRLRCLRLGGTRAGGRRRGDGRQPEELRAHHRAPRRGARRAPSRSPARARSRATGTRAVPRASCARRPRRQTVLRARPAEEVRREAQDVLTALAQWRHRRMSRPRGGDRDLRGTVAPAWRRQVVVAGRDDPDVDRLTPGGTQAPDGPVLERLEELGLERLRQEARPRPGRSSRGSRSGRGRPLRVARP